MFDEKYFRKRKFLAWRALHVCSAFKSVFNPTSIIDFGCSIGELVFEFNHLCIPAIGVDNSTDLFYHSHPETPILLWDICKELPTYSKFDLALCIEVIRFISDTQLEFLIDNFQIHSKRVFIGYGGDRKDYVIGRMGERGYTQHVQPVERLREKLERIKEKPAIKAIYHGGMYFTR